MKTQAKTKEQSKTQYVAITTDVQQVNQQVEKAYTLMVDAAKELLKRFDVAKFRTYALMDHTKNEQNTNLVKEFICYHWNITLSMSPKNGMFYIFIDLGEEALQKFGSALTNNLLRECYQLTQSNGSDSGIEYALRVNYLPADSLHNFYYRRIVEGETGYVSIVIVEKDAA